MRRITHSFIALATLLTVGFVGVPEAAADVNVVASVGDLGAMARAVVGPNGEVEVLAAPSEDPHFVDAKPSFVRALHRADVLVYNGMDLEVGWLPTLIKSARNPKINPGAPGHIDASAFVVRRGVPTGKVDRSQGDVHPGGNPHYTLDPRQMARVALHFGKRLAEIDPAHAAEYQERARAFAKDAIRLAQTWEFRFKELGADRRDVVVYHEAWQYVTSWLGLDSVVAVEPKPGVPPGPKHVAKVLEVMEKTGAKLVLRMAYYPDATTRLLADKTGATLIEVAGQTGLDERYHDRIDRLARSIYEALEE